MNRNTIIAAFFALVFLAGQNALAQSGYDLFQKGLVQERTEGDLNEAIRLYKQIVEDFTDDHALAAKALLQIGGCYEKLGRAEAQKAYQRVIEEYPGQKQEVAVAKERIAELSKALEEVAHKPTFRKISIPTKISWDAQLSPDGKKVILASNGKLWIMPLSGKLGPEFPGTPVKLNTGNVGVSRFGLAWSADGRWIAFNENYETPEKLKDIKGTSGIYVVPAQGDKPKKVYENYRGGLFLNYGISLSPDGKTLAFSSVDGNEVHICAISVDGGLPKQLVDASAREPAFSPDGKMIAYVEGRGGGLWVMPAHGGTPKLVANAGNAKSPIWSPDGNMIAFIDGNQTCIIPIGEDGEAAGQVMTIDQPETMNVQRLVGWTPDNKIGAVFGSHVEYALYTLPVKGGMAALVTHGGFPSYPRWSPDGKRIFHTNVADEGSGAWQRNTIAFVHAEGGKVTTVPIQSDAKIRSGGGNRVSPDGKTIVFSGMTQESSSMHIWTLPVEGGKPKQLTKAPAPITDQFPCWSPDGKAIAFVRARRSEKYFRQTGEMNIYIVQLNGGEPKPLKSESDHVAFGPIAWSPDGRLLAYFSRYEVTSPDGTLKVITVNGGESRVVGKVQNIHLHKELAWSPDSKRIAFNGPKYEDKVIKVISLNDGSIVDIETDLVDTNIYHLDWSPDGDRLVFAGFQGGDPEFWLMENFLPDIKPKVKVVRQVWDYARMGGRGNMGKPSPDGRYLLYADMKSINVCALEFATKKMHFITNEKVPWTISDNPSKKPVEFHWGSSIWSPDGKKVAYSWRKFKNIFVFNDAFDEKRNLKDSFKELRTIDLDGSNMRVLYSDDNLARVKPLDWSSDGKHILAEFIGKDNTRRLVMVSVADGSVRVLKTFDKLPRGNVLRIGDLFSPDGRHVVFDSWQKDSSKLDIHILSIDDSREAVLVEHPADDFVLGWTPDGKCLIFASDRTGTMSMWAIRISEGRPQGDTVLVKKDMGAIWPKGFDKKGSFYYASETRVSDVYMAEIDFETNNTMSEPKRMSERFVGSAMYSDFSPDGKYLAYISYTETVEQYFSNPVLCIRSLENGEERGIYPELGYIGGTCWSPDGRSILTVGKKESRKGFYKIDVKTGEFTSILQLNEGEIVGAPVWSQDGRKIFYMHTDPQQGIASIIMYDLASRKKKEIHRDNVKRSYTVGRPPFFAQELALSPDGQFLAFNVRDGGETILKIIPVSGGQAREVVRWNNGRIITTVDWTPNGKELLFAESKFQRGYKFNFWRISAEGGEPQELGLAMDRVYFLRMHPDGQHIAFRAGQKIKEIYAMDNFLPESKAGE